MSKELIQSIVSLFNPPWVWIESKEKLTKEELAEEGIFIEDPDWKKKDTNFITTAKIEKQ